MQLVVDQCTRFVFTELSNASSKHCIFSAPSNKARLRYFTVKTNAHKCVCSPTLDDVSRTTSRSKIVFTGKDRSLSLSVG